ncbi:MAG: hypothetical protein AABX84_00730 [Nanoarchaeota archaeon]
MKNKNHLWVFMNPAAKNKRGIISDYLPWLIIGIVVLVIILLAIFLLREKSIALIDQIKNLFKFG